LNIVLKAEREFPSRAIVTRNVQKQSSEQPANFCKTNNNKVHNDNKPVEVQDDEISIQDLKKQVNALTLLFQKKGFFNKSRGVQGGLTAKGASKVVRNLHPKPSQAMVPANDPMTCPLCKDKHTIELCKKFRLLDAKRRHGLIQKLKLCYHCLKEPHSVRDCNVAKDRLCGVNGCVRFHHALLHPDNSVKNKS
jgi:hypothetical protein